MDLTLDPRLAEGYKSASQIARRVTEAWFARAMYCPACPSPRLERTRAGARVVDFVCPACGAEFQVKAKSGRLGRKVRDAAYRPMVERARANRSPHFAFLSYDRRAWRVGGVFLVPGHFVTPQVIERCKPLSGGARRAGWVGCNILLDRIDPGGRVTVVGDGGARTPEAVRRDWARFAWLSESKGKDAEVRGWTLDVLRCVRTFGGRVFTAKDLYAFERHLAALHPNNRNVRAKIRQQLQILRDRGIVRFLGRGRYVAV